MAWYPGAVREPLQTRLDQRRRVMPSPVRINLHTAVSNSTSLRAYWDSQGVYSHFYVDRIGTVRQYQDTQFRAACDLDGNPDTISIETWDGYGPVWTGWADENKPPPWNPAQVQAIVELVRWLMVTHPTIPRRLATDNRRGPSSHGLSWHRLGVPGYATTVPRERGGLLYTLSRGKVCPGPQRERQIPHILAAVIHGDTTTTDHSQQEDDEMKQEDWERLERMIRVELGRARTSIADSVWEYYLGSSGPTAAVAQQDGYWQGRKMDAQVAALTAAVEAAKPGSVDMSAIRAAAEAAAEKALADLGDRLKG